MFREKSSKSVNAYLSKYKQLTMQVLDSYLPNKEPRKYLYDLVPSYPNRSGKGLRPSLCIATCHAFGGSTDAVLRSAASLELFHNAFLIHDDIEDGSEFRRGDQTLHAEHGLGIALNVGDAMNMLSMSPLMDNLNHLGPKLTWQVFNEIEHMVRESVEGQAMELGWVRDNVLDLSEADYMRMILKKTCWYTCIHPCRIGALIATGNNTDLSRFDRFAYYMGAAFQIQDDVLNLVGEEDKYGKEIGGDILEGKRTLILIHLLNNCNSKEKSRISRFLAKPRSKRKSSEVEWIFDLLHRYKSIQAARSSARHLAGASLREFNLIYGALTDSEDKAFIKNTILYMIERDL